MRLSDYQRDTARLLRDRSNILTPLSDLTSYINMARNDVCRATACVRCLITGNAPWGTGATPGLLTIGGAIPGNDDTTITTFQTIAGVEKYPFAYARPFLQKQFAGVERVIDLIEVSISWGAASRPTMEWWGFEELQSLGRIYSAGVFTYPFAAARQGDGINGSLFLFPVPSQALEMEWDATCFPKALYSDDDYEAIPDPFTGGVKYGAAMYAYLGSQRFGSADIMQNMMFDHLGLDRAAAERGSVPSYYTG